MSSAAAEEGTRFRDAGERFKGMASQKTGKRILVVLGTIVAAVALGAGLLRTDLFAVEQLDVSGNQRLSRDAVLRAAGLKTAMPLVSVDEGAAEARLSRDPWIASAVVTTKWPHTVAVAVEERKPLVFASTTDNRWAEVGDGGVVLAVSQNPPAGLPLALDVKVEPRTGARLDANSTGTVTVAAAIPESMRTQVVQIKQDQTGVRIGLASGVVVLVGTTDELGAKLTAAATVLRTADVSQIETLDVTSPAMPVSTPKVKTPPTTVATEKSASSQTKSSTTTTQPSTTKNSQSRTNN